MIDMQSRRYRDISQALRTVAATAFILACASFGASVDAAAQGGVQIQDGASTPSATAKPKRRLGTPQLGASTSGQKRQPRGFIDTLLQGPRLTTTTPEPADWVRRTRPPEGAPAPQRAATPSAPARPTFSADEVRRREAALDAARARHDRLAGRKPQGRRPAPAPKPEQKAETSPAACVMSCAAPIGVPNRR
jgi:hypothetical protein